MRIILTEKGREVFAAQRRAELHRGERTLHRSVRLALGRWGREGWYDALVRRAMAMARAAYREETGKITSQALRAELADFQSEMSSAMEKTTEPDRDSMPVQVEAIAASVATAAHNVAMVAAAKDLARADEMGKVWLSMEDADVRPAHADAHGQKVRLGEKFTVAGTEMDRPGDMSAPVELWINCRCILGIEYMTIEEAVTAAAPVGESEQSTGEAAMSNDDFEPEDLPDLPESERVDLAEEIPWYGVLAPEGVLSGDGRKFTEGALRTRDLPLPLSWQERNEIGHDGSVVVGRIDEAWRKDGQMRGRGVFLSTEDADRAVGLLAEGGIRGVSIDADDGTMEVQMRDGTPPPDPTSEEAMGISMDDLVTVFTDARICGATLCPIPAFQEAFVSLGVPPDDFLPGDELGENEQEGLAAALEEAEADLLDMHRELVFRSISEKPWDGSASRFTDDEWFRSTIVHLNGNSRVKSDNKLPILEPGGALSRAGVHAAAARLNQVQAPPAAISKAKASLRTAYRELGEELPDVLKADGYRAKTEDAPGWLTHPVDTDRLRDYWVQGRGAAKIGWGTPGDFNRCRTNLAKYIKPQHLSGYCANRHYDALGFWPGQHHALREMVASADTPALRMVDISAGERPPLEWFTDPHLTGPSPIVVTEDRHIFGHLAQWGTCHIGLDGVCTTAPPSATDYAYFRTGAVLTDGGEVPVGHITMGTGHAKERCGYRVAVGHYDDTGFCVADVAAGDDEWGVWVSGMVRPSATEEQVYALRSAVLSGDWRDIGGNLELVAALAVNVPGFPIPRISLAATDGHQISLVAAGIVTPGYTVQPKDIGAIVAAAIDEYEARQRRRSTMARLREKAHRDPRSRMAELAGRR